MDGEIYAITDRIDHNTVGVKLIVDGDREQLNELAGKVYRLLEYADFRRKSSVYQTLIYSGEIKQDLEQALSVIDHTLKAIDAQLNVTL